MKMASLINQNGSNHQAIIGNPQMPPPITILDGFRATTILALILFCIFLPPLTGQSTLLMSAADVPSVMPNGAYGPPTQINRVTRTPDAGAPGWQSEPWFKIIQHQYFSEHNLPLWNPYAAYGTPFAAAMLAQPFFPLTAALSLHPTPWTYNFFIVARLLLAGLLTYLFARLFLPHLPSLFSAVTFMLTGYFILFLDMPHLSVEILVPGFLLTMELILRSRSWHSIVGAALMILLGIVGGMPESLFLLVTFAWLYFFFRLAFTPALRRQPLDLVLRLAAANVLGFSLGAFLLLPFLEFMHHSHDVHQAANVGEAISGLHIDHDGRSIVLYLLPLIFGPVGNSIFAGFSGWTGLRGYWGILPCLFAAIAIVCLIRPKRSCYHTPLIGLTIFFSICLALMLLKRFGHPIINWIGRLPISDMVIYVKYQEPLMAFCVAMLAGIGFYLFAERLTRRGYILTAILSILLVILVLAGWSMPRVIEHQEYANIYYLTLIASILLILASVILIFFPIRNSAAQWPAWSLLGLLSLELFLNFVAPTYYIFGRLPPVSRNPYEGAPYVEFLRKQNNEHHRVFGRDGILYPNWAGVFELADIRTLDAMFYRRYITFIRNFLLNPGDERRRTGDLADRFTGAEAGYAYDFDTDSHLRFLQLSSVKYLLSKREYGASSKIAADIVAQHRFEKLWGFGQAQFESGASKSQFGVFQHPPSSRLTYRTVVDPARPVFEGTVVMKREAQDKSDGADFLLEIQHGPTIATLYATALNPRDNPSDQSGRAFRVDLSKYVGEEVVLLFSTFPGPNGNNAYDWVGWAGLRFSANSEPNSLGNSPFKQIYDHEVLIYELSDTLPRAALYRNIAILPDDDVLARLKDPNHHPDGVILLSQESLSAGDQRLLVSIGTAPSKNATPATITHYTSQYVRVEAQNDGPAILRLNDANYPGWVARVNGQNAPILKADYLFRAVILPPGANVVEFVYEPNSLWFGTAITTLAVMTIIITGIAGLIRSRRTTAQYHA